MEEIALFVEKEMVDSKIIIGYICVVFNELLVVF